MRKWDSVRLMGRSNRGGVIEILGMKKWIVGGQVIYEEGGLGQSSHRGGPSSLFIEGLRARASRKSL